MTEKRKLVSNPMEVEPLSVHSEAGLFQLLKGLAVGRFTDTEPKHTRRPRAGRGL